MYWNPAEEDDRQGNHLLNGRIIGVYDRSHRVANHGIVTCSCGWSSGEQITLIEAGQMANEQHPEGIEKHPGY